jgi:hypothetical protein
MYRIAVAVCPDRAELRTLLTDRATTDPDQVVRQVAVQALATGWPDEPTRTLLEHATTDHHETVRWAAMQALATGWPDKQMSR